MLEPASLPMERKTSCMAGAWPIIDAMLPLAAVAESSPMPLERAAFCTSSTASSISKGLGRYSNAPPL